MKLLDVNVLLYATNRASERHVEARTWLIEALRGPESLLVPWMTAMAYLRIATQTKALTSPVTVPEALAFLRALFGNTRVVAGEPDRLHLDRIQGLLAATGVRGNLVSDAHLAALAVQYDATVVSYDYDFSRFPGVRWERPTPPG